MRPWKTASLAVVLAMLCSPAVGTSTESGLIELEQSLRAAEMAFAASVAEKNLERFESHLDPDAIFMGGRILAGKEAILDAWKVYFDDNAPVLEWHPEDVAVRANGKMGITRGPYTLRTRTSDGQEETRTGSFSSVWELQKDGRWRILFDSGCAPCPDCESP